MERLCGCGSSYKCLKTGAVIKQDCYNGLVQSGDLHGCPHCGSLLIVAAAPYQSDREPQIIIIKRKSYYADDFIDQLEEWNDLTPYKELLKGDRR